MYWSNALKCQGWLENETNSMQKGKFSNCDSIRNKIIPPKLIKDLFYTL